jgi:hypothetical protein
MGGVPFWFITLWGSVGLLTRRLVLPAAAAVNGSRFGSATAYSFGIK